VTTALGVFDTNVSSGLTSANSGGVGVSNGSSWGSLSGNYREYRVLAIRAEFTPSVEGALPSAAVTALATTPWATIVDRDDSTAAGSYANITANESLALQPLGKCWMREAKMESTDESNFVPIGSSSTPGFMVIKSYLNTGSGTLGFGAFLYRWVVQFRTLIG
jgi:hypothetical protein